MKYYYREHWDENNNDNDDFILSVFFPLQWCGTMGTASKDMLDLTMTAVMMLRIMLKQEQKPEIE